MTLEKGWKKVLKVKNNNKKKNTFDMNFTNVKSIQIKMIIPLEKYMNQAIYGIRKLVLYNGGFPITREKCDNISSSHKRWIIEEQWFYVITKKFDYIRAYNNLSKTMLQLRSLSTKIIFEWRGIKLVKSNAEHINKLITDTRSEFGKTIKSI